MVQAPAPERVIDRGLPGPALLAHVITAKFCDHSPLYRQSQIFAREGIELDRSVLARWAGEAAALLDPVAEVLRRYVLDTDKVHGDDTPVPVLAPGTGKTKTGRFWTYVRDNRPAGDKTAPAVWFAYSPNRRGEHPPFAVSALAGLGCRDPVVHRARHDADRVCRLGLFANRDQKLGAMALLRMSKGLDLVECRLVQVDVLPERGHIAGLLADDLRRRVLDDARAVLFGLVRRADEILRRLADAPRRWHSACARCGRAGR